MSDVAALLRPPRWTGLQWPGARVVILASGESLSVDQCEKVRAWRMAEAAEMRRVIAINTTFRRAPWADVLWGCDCTWWSEYHAEVVDVFAGQLWTQDQRAVDDYGLHFIESQAAPGLCRRPGLINQGGNSAYMSLNLGVQAGARRFVLLGVDMHGSHWHGDHPQGLSNPAPYLFATWIKQFGVLAKDLAVDGIEVINCTPGTALHCFPEKSLQETLL
jgi:hypothetical protein